MIVYKIYEIEKEYPDFNADSETDDRIFDGIIKRFYGAWKELAKY